MTTNDEIYDTYKDWDMSNAKKGNTNPIIQRMQQAKANFEKLHNLPLDSDVVALIQQHAHNQKDVEKLNSMIRLLFA